MSKKIARFLAGVAMLLCSAVATEIAGPAGHSLGFFAAMMGVIMCAWTCGALDA